MEEYLKKVKVTTEIVSSLFDSIKFIEKLLSNIEVQYWWCAASELDNEDYNQLLNLRFGKNIPSKEGYIVTVQNKYRRLKSTLTDFSQKLSEDETFIMKCVSPASALYKLFNEKSRERYHDDDFKHHVLFDILCDIRLFSYKIHNNLFSGNDSMGSASMRKEFQKLIYSLLVNKEDSKNDLSAISANFIQNEKYDFIFGAFNLLFVLLNTDLCGVENGEVVNYIGAQPSNLIIQKWYDQYSAGHQGFTRNFEFAKTIHKLLKSEDFDWEAPRSPLCFNILWHSLKVQDLYNNMLGKYLDEGTDVRSFCYFLTGCKPRSYRQDERCRIVWIEKDKQSAALFLGKMKELDSRNSESKKLAWSKIPTLIWRDKELIFHSSTQYNQALRSGKYLDLLQAIDSVKEKEYDKIIKGNLTK